MSNMLELESCLVLGVVSSKKGGEIRLPTCVHCHVANSTRGGGRLVEKVDLTGHGVFTFLFFCGDPRIQRRAFQAPLTRRRDRGSGCGRADGTGTDCGDG